MLTKYHEVIKNIFTEINNDVIDTYLCHHW